MASQHSRCRRTRGRAPALHLEELEGRTLLSVCTVDRLTDLGEGKEMAGDLRYCITHAADGDSITFKVNGTINLTRTLPDLTRSISIEGPGADLLTVRRDTGGHYRIFKIPSGATIGLSGLRIANGRSSDGGGIYNAGTLSISSSVVSENVVLADFVTGGGIANFGTVALSDSTVTRNVGGEVAGGIYNAGTMTISNSTVSDNQSYTVGGIANGDEGTLTVGNSTVSGNQGYGLWNSGTLMVTSSRISGSYIGIGVSTGTASVRGSTIADNRGGGISNDYGTVTVSTSTISGNRGQGIYNSRTLTVNNSTISGNTSLYPRVGGGITNRTTGSLGGGDATVELVNATIVDNSTTSTDRTASQVYTGRWQGKGQAIVRFRDTIVSGGGQRPNFFADAGGTLVSEGHNLSNDDSGDLDPKLGDLPNTDPLLGPLQDNGGPTFTHALLPGSPAIDAGDNTDAPKWDQRGEGFARIVNEVIDIGAFEVQGGRGSVPPLRPGPDGSTNGSLLDLFVSEVLGAGSKPWRRGGK